MSPLAALPPAIPCSSARQASIATGHTDERTKQYPNCCLKHTHDTGLMERGRHRCVKAGLERGVWVTGAGRQVCSHGSGWLSSIVPGEGTGAQHRMLNTKTVLFSSCEGLKHTITPAPASMHCSHWRLRVHMFHHAISAAVGMPAQQRQASRSRSLIRQGAGQGRQRASVWSAGWAFKL